MNKANIKLLDFFTRYLILIIVAIPSLWIFYYLFTPITIYPVYFLLNLFFDATLYGNTITLGGTAIIEIIKACIVGSAYYLLLILNLATPKIKLRKRIIMIVSSFAILLLINILRLFLLSILFVSKSISFDLIHKLFWYIGSIIIVVAIWFIEVKIFRIKAIPFYTDIKFFLKSFKNSKKTKRSK